MVWVFGCGLTCGGNSVVTDRSIHPPIHLSKHKQTHKHTRWWPCGGSSTRARTGTRPTRWPRRWWRSTARTPASSTSRVRVFPVWVWCACGGVCGGPQHQTTLYPNPKPTDPPQTTPTITLHKNTGAAKPMISPRDFVFVSHKVPPGDVGGPFGAQAFVQVRISRWISCVGVDIYVCIYLCVCIFMCVYVCVGVGYIYNTVYALPVPHPSLLPLTHPLP